ncbi:MAG: TRAP transporter large permease subunit [Chitinivibrionales bacterium]|nr:TRAP transporter large permease subunit [Chitinivibrionales bacterium]
MQAVARPLYYAENGLVFTILGLIVALPLIEIVGRFFRSGLHGSTIYRNHLVIWIAFAGGMVTSRSGRHLALTIATEVLEKPARKGVGAIIGLLSSAVCTALAWSSWQYLNVAFAQNHTIGILPVNVALAIMPVGFGVMAIRFIAHAPPGIACKLVALAGPVIALVLGFPLSGVAHWYQWPSIIVLIAAAFFGLPIFVALGGIAAMLFFTGAGTIAIIPDEAYIILRKDIMPSIPLFTVTGYLLSESNAGKRLVCFFNEAFGWLPGGIAIMAIVACAFFTTFTGASGVTILALGGLLSYVLTKSGYPKGYSEGLLTASGSIGLLFPPSLPIILYGVVAHVNIKHMFVGGLIPGMIMVVALAGLAIVHARKHKITRRSIKLGKVMHELKSCSGELLLPVLIIISFLMGWTTLAETGAVAVVYAIVLEVVIHRDISLRTLPGVILKGVPILGGILIIIAVSQGVKAYLVDEAVPQMLATWCREAIESKIVFLLLLNVALLLTGCFMDIFSALFVVVPLIIPLGEAYGIHPIHLGIIFLANLELGYLTPPVGMNLFLASYRFEEPLHKIYRNVLPFLIALLVAVLLITYLPLMTTGLLFFVE